MITIWLDLIGWFGLLLTPSNCHRYTTAELFFVQPGDKLNGEADKLQCRVIFVPDIWTLMPNEAEWANIKEQYKQYGESKALKLEPPPPPQLQQNTDLEEEMLDEEELLMETTDLTAAETAAAADACEETESEKETSTTQQKHPSQTQTPKNAQEKAYYKLYRLILQQNNLSF